MEAIFIIAIIVISVVIHEVSHGYAADILGDPTARLAGRLTLNPLPHLDLFGSIILPLLMALLPGGMIIGWAKPVPYNPYNLRARHWGPAIVAAAGPLSNLLIAAALGVVARFGLGGAALAAPAGAVVLLNLSLAAFNLMPIPPLDGSKILFALIPYRYRALGNFLERYWIILFILFLFFVWNLISVLIVWLAMLLAGPGAVTAAFLAFFSASY